jgi:N-acetylglucosaminyldiphosphoundecaprenol N-acetyl-beta-D-mannosaminyltransferase
MTADVEVADDPPVDGHGEFSDLAATCYAGTVDGAAALVIERARAKQGGYVCLCNVHVMSLARADEGFRKVLRDAWLRLPDGAPVAWLQRRLGSPVAERVGGPDLMARVVELGLGSGMRHFFLGSTPAVLSDLERRLRAAAPGLRVAGRLSPPFEPLTPATQGAIERVLASAAPDVVWVGLGAPKQENWMQALASATPTAVLVGVGAAFDFHAGTKRRAPSWMRRWGLEWLHRLVTEPRRLTGRYVRSNTAFLSQVPFELLRRRGAPQATSVGPRG